MEDLTHNGIARNWPRWGTLGESRTLSVKTLLDLLRALEDSSSAIRARWDQELRLNIPGMNATRASLILALLNQGHATQAQLAKHTGMSEMTMTRLLDDLEERGWVRRESVAKDRRAHAVQLTAEGRKFAAMIYSNTRHLVRRDFQSLDEKRAGELIVTLAALR